MNSLDPDFLKARDASADRLRANARAFDRMADYIADSKTPEQLNQRIAELQQKAHMESGMN